MIQLLKTSNILITSFFALVLVQNLWAQQQEIDFRYKPSQYYTLISLPDDWQKSMATETGALAYDFGPGPYARHLTEIRFGIRGDMLEVEEQSLPNGKAPLISTTSANRYHKIHTKTFSIVPDRYSTPELSNQVHPRVRRHHGWNGALGWAKPDSSLDPSFANVAWGTNRAIHYSIQVEPGTRRTIALGFLEAWKGRAGDRAFELRLEGAQSIIIDPLRDGIKGRAYVYSFNASDTNRDGYIELQVHPSAQAPDPNTFLNTFWVFPPSYVAEPNSIARGEHNDNAEIHFDCGQDAYLASPTMRFDAIVAQYDNFAQSPIVSIRTNRSLQMSNNTGTVTHAGKPFLLVHPRPVSMQATENGYEILLAPGTQKASVIAIHGSSGNSPSPSPDQLEAEWERAFSFWNENTIVPSNPILVPDSSLQFLTDAAIRNMYQVRERVDGKIQYQPGPSVYRGLWIADLILTGDAVLAAGDTSGMRRYLEAILPYQLSDGHFRAMVPNVSLYENPSYSTGALLYARATNDKDWLRRNWISISRGVDWIIAKRESTLSDPMAPNFGLLPSGFVDGGISTPGADYGSVWWSMVALDYAIRTAEWAGQINELPRWRSAYNGMLIAATAAANRDMQKDARGIEFLPIMVGQKNPPAPLLGQYGFIWPARYARFFYQPSSFLSSVLDANLKLFDAYKQQGLVTGTGWLENGIWIWLSGKHGSVQLYRGQKDKAIATAYALANHAGPTGTWVEEQLPKDLGSRTTGDVSNSESSAAFYLLVKDLIAQERGDTLHLFGGIPKEWIKPGAKIALKGSYSQFGPLNLELSLNEDATEAEIRVDAIDGRGMPGAITIDMSALIEAGFEVDESISIQNHYPFRNPINIRMQRYP
jgi:hypothetical protein